MEILNIKYRGKTVRISAWISSMASLPPLDLPSSFDPAIYLHSEPDLVHLPSCGTSDDFEALNIEREESIAAKNRGKVVIQHRAWAVADVFRSEEDYQAGSCSIAAFVSTSGPAILSSIMYRIPIV